MYLPYYLTCVLYGFRAILQHYSPANMQMRKALVFFTFMLSLVLLMGCFTGYMRWLDFQTNAPQVEAEVISQGRCAEGEVFEEGRFRRAYKASIIVPMEQFRPDHNPYADADHGSFDCIGYRFFTTDRQYAVYAREMVSADTYADWPLHSKVMVQYEPKYLQNNWLTAYLPATMAESMKHALFFAGVLMEAIVGGYIVGIRLGRNYL